jgi:hypothetical protein
MKQRMSIFIMLMIIFSGIFFSDQLGWWATESEKVPKVTASGDYDPGDIRGSYTFLDIENAFDVSVLDLALAFGVEGDDLSAFQVKNLEEIYADIGQVLGDESIEIGTASVRYFVSLYTGIESDLVEKTWLSKQAYEILLEQDKIGNDSEVIKWVVQIDTKRVEPSVIVDTSVTDEVHEEPIIKGTTTVQEVLNTGLTLEDLESVLGFKISSRAAVIKELCSENGMSFSEVKSALTLLLESRK